MAFVRMTRPGGRVLVVEPDEQSASAFRSAADEHGMSHATVVCAAAWDERTKLVLERDPGHPATNFTAGTADYAHDDLARFEAVEVDAVPVDDLLEEHGFGRVDIVSVTTNGAEARILNGLRRTIKRDRPVICLARTEDSYDELMTGLGYELAGDDDRGFTFVSRTARS
jgi:FkbM family methyltransferase